jgi:release factor glutamine methyltransferase
MRHLFPSDSWAAAYKQAINDNAKYRTAGRDWKYGALAMIVRRDAALGIDRELAVFLDVHEGECRDCRMVDVDAAHEAPYVVVADYVEWKNVIRKRLDPIRGLMEGRLDLVKGNLPTLVKHVRSSKELVETTSMVDSKFYRSESGAESPSTTVSPQALATRIAQVGKELVAASPYGIMDFLEGKVIVLPTVASVDMNTPMMARAMSKVATDRVARSGRCVVLEMGMGSGASILTVAKIPGVRASATDINPMAVLCAKANALWWNVKCDIYEGDLFSSVPKERFDLVFWNEPFLKTDPGGIEGVEYRALFDPGYRALSRFLKEVGDYLAADGELYLTADRLTSDLGDIHHRIEAAGWRGSVALEEEVEYQGSKFPFQVLKVERA